MWFALFVCLGFRMVHAQDPAGSWLSYAAATQGANAKITALNCSWVVPKDPIQLTGSNAPGWWYGVQTANGRGALIQPILAWADGAPRWTIFNGVFDWNDGSWHQSRQITVKSGAKIAASVVYDASDKRYVMTISDTSTGQTISTPYMEHPGQIESVAYFVLEHQPRSCRAYPPDGQMSFTNIVMEVDGKKVTPKWEAKQERPACDSQAIIVSPTEIKFTWSASSANLTNFDDTAPAEDFNRFRHHWTTNQ